jgi:diguanylate cyclase (GGDEF)-like protein
MEVGAIVKSVTAITVIRVLFVSSDATGRDCWIEQLQRSLTINAAIAVSTREALIHLSEEAVDVIVAGATLDDGTRDELLAEIGTRHPTIPIIAIGAPNAPAPLETFDHGAIEALAYDETPRLAALMLRAMRDADLGRALRSAHDELHGVLRTSDQQVLLLANTPALIWSTDELLILRVVEGAEARAGVLGVTIADWDPTAGDNDRARVIDAHRDALAGATTTIRANWLGRRRYLTVSPVFEGDRICGTAGAALAIAAADVDISAGVSDHDPVTDLPNRAIFEQRVGAALRDCAAGHSRVAVFFVDVDRFKSVNDLGGHAAGDTVLRAIAHRLRITIGERDAIARFSADEFVVLAVGLDDPARADALGQALLGTFAEPFTYGAHEFHLTASIGMSIGPDDADRPESLIVDAEAASFDAKRMGRNVLRRYVPSMVATPSERHMLQRELMHAIEREQLELLYQPIYDVVSGNVVSVEALVRWRHPTLGLIVPDRFIPMAEESGLIGGIGEWVISRVCEQIRRWVDAGVHDVHVSLNVSARQLDRLLLHRFIGDAIRVNGIDPSMLEIEVTETSILRDVYGATLLLRELRSMGLSVAIDDFGAGFTSLAFLRDLPIDHLKIDRSFVRDVATGAFDGAVVSAVVTLARSLGLRTIAEGVEDHAQMDVLRELRCDAVQGYLFSRPMPAEQCAALFGQKIA